MVNEIKCLAPAKINLCLDVLGLRDDGYHDVRTVMQSVSLYDTLTVKRVDKPNYMKVICDVHFVPTDERNLAYRGAKALIERYGLPGGVFIDIKKRIPVAAGLAGGSADCAAAMIATRDIYGKDITNAELSGIGGAIGADVPFCLQGGTALGEGRGDKLSPLRSRAHLVALLVKPAFCVSTESVFRAFDAGDVGKRPDVYAMMAAIEAGSFEGICEDAVNVLESVTAGRHPIIAGLKARLTENGAGAAFMSGSGPTVCGLFRDRSAADIAAGVITTEFGGVVETFITETVA